MNLSTLRADLATAERELADVIRLHGPDSLETDKASNELFDARNRVNAIAWLQHEQEQRIAHDLDLCDVGMTLATGKARAKYARHRKACVEAIKAMNVRDGLEDMSVDELAASLMES